MNDEIREMLDEEIQSQIEAMSSLEAGSKEQTAAAENIATLIRLGIEDDKNAKAIITTTVVMLPLVTGMITDDMTMIEPTIITEILLNT